MMQVFVLKTSSKFLTLKTKSEICVEVKEQKDKQ